MNTPNPIDLDVDALIASAAQSLGNYIIPGIESHLLGESPRGRVRMFVNRRRQHALVTPHSHRFALQSLVVRGSVMNTLWQPTSIDDHRADAFEASQLTYLGAPGKYSLERGDVRSYIPYDTRYNAGNTYAMEHTDIHSIIFERDAVVIVFEGPTVTDTSTILQPVVNNTVVRTFEVKPWMFTKLHAGD